MLLEAISFSFNLGFFSCVLWSIFSFQSIRLVEKLKRIPMFIGFSILFYLLFYVSSLYHTRIFELKSFYFNGYTILFQVFLIGFFLFIGNRSMEFYAPVLSIFISPYIFFLLFGLEEFTFGESSISSYSLLKTQNPIIGLTSLFIFLIKPNKIQIPTFVLVIGILFYHVNPLKNFPFPEIHILHYKYIPYEFFLKDNAYLFEENSGIYTEKKQNMDDVLYKFTMRPVKNINLPLKQGIQTLVSNFEFPILVTEGNNITLLEISRTYNHSIFKVVFQMNKNSSEIEVIGSSKTGLDTAIIKIEGPLF